jgi:hypothetical protein
MNDIWRMVEDRVSAYSAIPENDAEIVKDLQAYTPSLGRNQKLLASITKYLLRSGAVAAVTLPTSLAACLDSSFAKQGRCLSSTAVDRR